MKFRGPGSSLNPARETARSQARALAHAERSANTGSPAAAATAGWQLAADDAGRLVARHLDTGRDVVLADTPEGEPQRGN